MIEILFEEYFEAKKKNYKSISKNFSKAFEVEQGVFALEDLVKVCKDIMGENSNIQGFQFPREYTMTRVFAYSLTANRNKYDITAKEFMSSVLKFGLDCPFPSIRTNYNSKALFKISIKL